MAEMAMTAVDSERCEKSLIRPAKHIDAIATAEKNMAAIPARDGRNRRK